MNLSFHITCFFTFHVNVLSPFTVRLVGGDTKYEGRIEILYSGEWGTICDSWTHVMRARVVCKQLGFYGGEERHQYFFGKGSGRVWLAVVSCTGDESEVGHCNHRGWGNVKSGCDDHSYDVGVICGE